MVLISQFSIIFLSSKTKQHSDGGGFVDRKFGSGGGGRNINFKTVEPDNFDIRPSMIVSLDCIGLVSDAAEAVLVHDDISNLGVALDLVHNAFPNKFK